jgi:alpha,alpha-trehalose-phosphate synthase [UDP-forming]/trehalose-phosphatase
MASQGEASHRQLIVVANRLPVEPIVGDDPDGPPQGWQLAPGGLVSALDAVLRDRTAIWVGNGGNVPDDLGASGLRLEAVRVPRRDAEAHYAGFSNKAIWPLFHSSVVTPEFHRAHFASYQRVNHAFADHVGGIAEPGATVWVHDYQLLLVPSMLRDIRPDLHIGFFLHIPFPPPDLFAQLPWRREVLLGMLGADLIGMQTHSDVVNASGAMERFLGLTLDSGRVAVDERSVALGAFPIGIDAAHFAVLASDPAVRARAVELRAELGNPETLILGVDRLDYTKGIDIRIRAFSELLESERLDPTRNVLVQLAVPSRENLSEYQSIRDEIEMLVGRSNGAFASFDVTPIHYLRRSLDRSELVALYLAADIMLVTPLRDGMNLVGKEYVATRVDDSGALILSEFAGAAAQLGDAWLVNPFDTMAVAQALLDVIGADADERRYRMRRMRAVVFGSDAQAWATDFLDALDEVTATRSAAPLSVAAHPGRTVPLEELATTPHLLVCCDYDGTLAPIVEDPGRALPLPHAVTALRALSILPSTTVAVVSGRALRDLALLSRLPSEIHLIGSHGGEFDHDFELNAHQRRLLDECTNDAQELAATCAGAFVERKPSSVAIHIRRCTEADGRELMERLVMGPGQFPGVLVRHGKQVIELSVVHAHKSDAVALLRHRVGATAILFIGDDITDESVFAGLSGPDVGVKVGEGETAAGWRVDTPADVANLIITLTELRERWLLGGHAAPIEEHIMLSDRQSVALLAPDGSIDWFCAPEPESPAVFASLLGDESSGHFTIRPRHGMPMLSQTYIGGTLTARTRWADLTVHDYMPVPTDWGTSIVRIVREISGREPAVVTFAPRPQFGALSVSLEAAEGGLRLVGSSEQMALYSPGVEWIIEGPPGRQSATALVDPSGGNVVLEYRFGTDDLSPPDRPEPETREQTIRYWRDWVRSLSLPGIRPAAEERAALTLRALCHGATGGVLAAATSSLPERIGGVRNWDYRFCWIRDAALTVRELVALGSTEEADAFIRWLLGLAETVDSPEHLRPVYSLHGQPLVTEGVIDTLSGYAGSRPVRIGNAAAGQLQLDVYGPVVMLIADLARLRGCVSDEEWKLVVKMVDAVTLRWSEPDHGIWEIRDQPRRHTHSRMMCWLTVDHALTVAEVRGEKPQGWAQLKDAIAFDIENECWNGDCEAYVAATDLHEADAAVLQGILEGYPAPVDRVIGTVAYVERELRRSQGVYRYRYDDGLPAGEGAMHICSAWLAAVYVRSGALDDAHQMLDAILDAAGASGLLPEQIDPHSGRGLGNHPQAYSHVGVLATARLLASSQLVTDGTATVHGKFVS